MGDLPAQAGAQENELAEGVAKDTTALAVVVHSMEFLLNLFFPRKCLVCGKTGQYFCLTCRQKLPYTENQICPVCQKPSFDGATHPVCRKPLSLDGLLSAFYYRGVAKEAIKKLKYRLTSDLVHELVEVAFHNPKLDRQFPDFLLVPIPLHPERKKWRGFNQSELLAIELQEKVGGGVRTDILTRTRNTRPQVECKGEARKGNMTGAFSCLRENAAGKNFVLVDDVLTTGATLAECAKALKRAGAGFVWGFVLAR